MVELQGAAEYRRSALDICVAGLTAGAQYWFNVLARDSSDNVAAYASHSTTMLTKVVSTAAVFDSFTGYSTAISADGSTLVLGAPGNASLLAVGSCGDTISGRNDQGSPYLYTRRGTAYGSSPTMLYEVSTGSASDCFGKSVSLSEDGTLLAVGVPGEDGSDTDTGAALMFQF